MCVELCKVIRSQDSRGRVHRGHKVTLSLRERSFSRSIIPERRVGLVSRDHCVQSSHDGKTPYGNMISSELNV